MELTFTPATITKTNAGKQYSTWDQLPAGAYVAVTKRYEMDVAADDRLLIGVPAGHDTVFTVGPYTITLDL